MTNRLQSAGFAVIELLVILLVVLGLAGTGWYVWHARHAQQIASTAAKTASQHQPASFDECVRAGGTAQINTIITSPGHNDALGYATCQIQNTEPPFQSGNDSRCTGSNECYDIVAAARQICATPAIPDPGTNAVFVYDPVTNGDFARMDLRNCSHNYSDQDITKTIFLKRTAGKWSIYRVTGANILCKDVDGTGIPLGLDWTCTDATGMRIVNN